MIYPTKKIKVTAIRYAQQFIGKPYRYYNTDFFVTRANLKEIYIFKYNKGEYQPSLNPLKVRVL